jgi:hypothetical protein
MAAWARLLDAIRGGPRGHEREREAAAEIEERWPGTGEMVRRAARYHSESAVRAVGGGEAHGRRWAGARAMIFADAGHAPAGYREAVLPHAAAARAAPGSRHLYLSADEAITLLWHGLLAPRGPEPAATAAWAASDDPRQAAGMARMAGLDEPWGVQLQMIAHWWPDEVAREVVAGWAEAMPSGSSLMLTVPAPGGIPAGGEFGKLVASVTGAMPCPHSPQAIASWITGAGLLLGPQGVTDVRARPGRGWAGPPLAAGAAGIVLAAGGLKP